MTKKEMEALIAELKGSVEATVGGIVQKMVAVDGAPPVAPGDNSADEDVDILDLVKAIANVKGFAYTPQGQAVLQKALSEGTDSAGGYLVPTGFLAKVVERKQQLINLTPRVTRVPVTTDKGEIPSLTTDISVTWGTENTNIDETDPVFDQLTWDMHRANALTKISRELLGDSGIDIRNYLTQKFAEAMARAEDTAIAIGSGSDQPLGFYSASGISAVSVSGDLTYEKMVDIEQTVDERYRDKCVWVSHKTTKGYIRKIKDGAGTYIFVRGRTTGAGAVVEKGPDMALGYPLLEANGLPTTQLFFGDLSFYWMFDRERAEIEATTQGGESFQKHQLWLKITQRLDGKLTFTDPWAKGTGITGPT